LAAAANEHLCTSDECGVARFAVCGVPSRPINEGAVMKYWRKFMLMAFLLIPVVGLSTGCEVDADADDDGAELKIDTD
jgi:hypothetical protein